MPLNLINQTDSTVITYRGKPAGAYVCAEGVGRVTLAFSCSSTAEEVGTILGGLQEGLSYLKRRHPKHSSVRFILDTSVRYNPLPGDEPTAPNTGLLSFSMTYECDMDEWIVPLSWFHRALNRMNTHQEEPAIVVAKIETDESDIAETIDGALLYLTEKEIKRHGYIWKFHQNDLDRWPSDPHGHDYEKGLKLDVYTGHIYDAATRSHLKTLKKKKLCFIQEKLQQCLPFANKLRLGE